MSTASIYRDPLGNPAPSATVSALGGTGYGPKPGCGAAYVLHRASDAPSLRWDYTDRSVIDVIVNDLAANGWRVESRGYDGYGNERLTVIHEATEALALQLSAPAVEAKAKGASCYVRLGSLPASGHSHNHRDNHAESGVSVFRARRYKGVCLINVSTNDEIGSLLSLINRPLYVVTGKEIGNGSDGEPLLTGCVARRIRDRVYMEEK